MMPDVEQVLRELKEGLEAIYGPRLKGLYLFGSRARGEAEEDSDIDVAVVLEDYESAGAETDRCAEFLNDLCLRRECVIAMVPIREADWLERQTPLLMNVRREGVAIA